MSTYLQKVLGPQSKLAEQLDHYETRSGQMKMAEAVDAAMTEDYHIAIEAPTGTGKSMAYSIPAIFHAVHEKKKVIIVTENIVLQEQLINKDLPFMQRILPWKFSFTLLKGRNNYACQAKTEEVVAPVFDKNLKFSKKDFNNVKEWAENTDTGDRSELEFEPDSSLWSMFSTSAEDCRKKDCRNYDTCFCNVARKEIFKSDVIVTNYHILFANVKSGGKILPAHQIVILDEAHNIADIARDFFGWNLSFYGVRNVLSKWDGIKARETITFFRDLADYSESAAYRHRLMESEHLKKRVNAFPVIDALKAAKEYYVEKADELNDFHDTKSREKQRDFYNLIDRCDTYIGHIEDGMNLSGTNVVYFIETNKYDLGALCCKPINVSKFLQEQFFEKTEVVVLTSATLTADNGFSFMRKQIGCLPDTRELMIESPFDFYKQCAGIAISSLPDPNDRNYPDAVAAAIEEIVEHTDGRCLGLFTSNAVLKKTYDRIVGNGHTVFRQGEMPRTRLIEAFKEDTTSVLLGTNSFWAGVDIPGESLSCVIIDKLPFQQLSDPVLNAIQAMDRNSFWNYQIPKAIIRFKQGFGRLIRRKSDRGIVVILDPRVHTKTYGPTFQASLPRMQWGDELSDIKQVLHLITSRKH